MLLLKKRLKLEDSSMKLNSKLLVLRDNVRLRLLKPKLRPEDSSMKLPLRRLDKKRKLDIKPG